MNENNKTTFFSPSLYGGRFTRKQYVLPAILAGIIVSILNSVLQAMLLTEPSFVEMMRSPSRMESFQQESALVGLMVNVPATIFIFLPLGIKRAHDIGHKGTFFVIISVLGLLSQLLTAVSYESGLLLSIVVSIVGLIYGCILFFKDSEKGTNEYGPSIKYPDAE